MASPSLRKHTGWFSFGDIMFNLTAKEITLWKEHFVPPTPHQERIPFVMLFRPLQVRNFNWIDNYGEDYDI